MDPFTVTSLTNVLGRMLPEPHAGLLAGILFGTRSTLSQTLTDAFITTGTIHIIALSGQNLSIFTGVLANQLASWFSRRLSSMLIIFLLVWFLWFVGPSPSLVRAVIMGSLTLLAVIFGRRNLGLLSLVLAVSSMLVLNPSWIGDLSFQLSALATLGIILFGGDTRNNTEQYGAGVKRATLSFLKSTEGPPDEIVGLSHVIGGGASLNEECVHLDDQESVGRVSLKKFSTERKMVELLHWSISQLKSFIIDDLRITLAAQLFTTPLIFFHFHRLSLMAPLTNVLIGWTMPILMRLGWIAALAGFIWLPLGYFPAWTAWVLLTYVIRAVEVTAVFPFASVVW